MAELPDRFENSIAVIGMSCRFPKSKNIGEFWNNLKDGVSGIQNLSDDCLIDAGVDKSVLNKPGYIKVGALLGDIEKFDADFFRFSTREAEIASPEQRFLLECAYEAIEDAGYDLSSYEGTIGIFTSVPPVSSYYFENIINRPDILNGIGKKTALFGNESTFSATQITYKLNLTGAGIHVATACSSSLVALHLACQSLLDFQNDMVLVGAAQISVNQNKGYQYIEGGIHSPDGYCRAFDQNANGTVSGNGAACILLKRLKDAIEDGDHIDAVILGSAINNDGNEKVGYSAPSVRGQAMVIAEAHLNAGVCPQDITVVEAHGTGTQLGDPIEFSALKIVFGRDQTHKNYCALGSLKSNLGHMGPAAGLGGLIKVILSLKNKQIPPSLNIAKPNDKLGIEDSSFYLNTTLKDWLVVDETGKQKRRIAGVSSFGMGGTNAHVVVSEWLENSSIHESLAKPDRSVLMCFSAKSHDALKKKITNFSMYLKSGSANLENVAFTLNLGRESFQYRASIACSSATEAIEKLSKVEFFETGGDKPIVFAFPGQGTQYWNMAKELYVQIPMFRVYLDQCAEECKKLNFDLLGIIFSDDEGIGKSGLEKTSNSQIALFSIEYSLAMLWQFWGVSPNAMIGHSLGEYVAACISGVLTLPNALGAITYRARLMESTTPGRMVSLMANEDAVKSILIEGVSIAAINGENLVVVSGSDVAIADFIKNLPEGFKHTDINAKYGFHSILMDPILAEYEEYLNSIRLEPPRIPFISNVSGTWITDDEATSAHYWVRHLRSAVLFFDGIKTLESEKNWLYVECGPNQAMSTLIRRILVNKKNAISSLPDPRQSISELHTIFSAAGKLWEHGKKIAWKSFFSGRKITRCHLPTYPFQRNSYWIEKNSNFQSSEMEKGSHRIPPKKDAGLYVPVWTQKRFSQLYAAASGTDIGQCWLVVHNGLSISSEIIKKIKCQGFYLVLVTNGERYQRVNESEYVINANHKNDYELLIQSTIADGKKISRIVNMLPLASFENISVDHVVLHQNIGFFSQMYLQQAVARYMASVALKMTAIGNGLHCITGLEQANPALATLSSLCRVINQEFPETSCSYIDLGFSCIDDGAQSDEKFYQATLSYLVSELIKPDSLPNLAVRGNLSYTQSYIKAQSENSDNELTIKEQGVYIITGGLGGIGMQLAYFLAENHCAKIVLLSRSAPYYISGEISDSPNINDELREQFSDLENMGARIISLPLNIANEEKLSECIEIIESHFGAINGVIHAAGLPGGGFIELKSKQDVLDVFEPKINGAVNLVKKFEQKKLDFMLFCSSHNSIKGGVARADYSSANAFLDALCSAVVGEVPFRLLSVNWCSWAEVGMAYRNREQFSNGKDDFVEGAANDSIHDFNNAISNKESGEIFQRILSCGEPRVVVSKVDVQEFSAGKNSINKKIASIFMKSDMAYVDTKSISDDIRYSSIELELIRIWKILLGSSDIDIHENYFAIGGNSLVLSQLLMHINKSFEIKLSLQDLFECQTIYEQAERILSAKVSANDQDELELLLAELENMPDDQIQNMMSEMDC